VDDGVEIGQQSSVIAERVPVRAPGAPAGRVWKGLWKTGP
jgi:hypothetical protein